MVHRDNGNSLKRLTFTSGMTMAREISGIFLSFLLIGSLTSAEEFLTVTNV